MMNGGAFQCRLDDGAQCVLDDAIPKRHDRDGAGFGIADPEGASGPGPPRLGMIDRKAQTALQGKTLGLSIHEEARDLRACAFTPCRHACGGEECIQRRGLFERAHACALW